MLLSHTGAPGSGTARHAHLALPRASELALLLARLDGVADRLLAEHVPDRDGRHCRGCALPQSGSTPWPCTLHEIALQARSVATLCQLPRPDR